MSDEILFLYLALPLCVLLGLYLLIRCIPILWGMIMPAVHHRFRADSQRHIFYLPKAERYTIHIVFPPLTVFIGTAYFSAHFAIKARASRMPIVYHSASRSLFSVRRTDMRGYASQALGYFDCMAPGDYEIACLSPDKIRPDFQLEISPYASSLKLVVVILGTLFAAGMTMGGTIVSLLWLACKIG